MVTKENGVATTLNVITVVEEPFVNYPSISYDVNFRRSTGPGIVMDILREIGTELNIKYNIELREDGQWGEYVNGQWNGMVGMLQRKEVDLLAGAVIIREDRAKVIDYSYPFMSSESGMMIRSPDAVDDDKPFLIISAPVEWHVWFIYAVIFFVSAFVLKLFIWPLTKSQIERHLSWIESVWLFYSIMMLQEFKKLPQSLTLRTLLAFWYLIALTFAAVYTGNMIAIFAVSKQVFPFTDVPGLVDKMVSEDYRVVFQNTTSSRMTFIKSSNLELFKTMWYQMTVKKKWVNVTTMQAGINEVLQNKKNVFIGPIETLRIYSAATCNLSTLDNGLNSVWFALAFQKQSNYTQIFSDGIQKLTEAGFIDKWLNDYLLQIAADYGDLCQFKQTASADSKPINFKTAQGAFWTILLGTLVALLSFSLEMFYYYYKRKKSQTQVTSINNNDEAGTSAIGRIHSACRIVSHKLEHLRGKRFSVESTRTVQSKL